MADVNIGAKLTLDTGQSFENLKQLNAYIKEQKDALQAAKYGSDEYAKASTNLASATNLLSRATKEKASSFGMLKDQLKGTLPAFEGASSGAMSFGKQLLALAANPIVLIITAIVSGLKGLYEAFTSTMSGAQKVEQIFSGLSAVVRVVIDRIVSLANAVIKFFSGDFKGAFADAKAAVSGVGDEIARVYNRTVELTKQLQKIRQEEREDAKDQAARKAKLAELREMLNDEDISLKERKRMANELKRLQEQNAKEDLDRQQRKTAIEIEMIKQKKNLTEKDLDDINQKEIEVENARREAAMEGVRINKVIRNLDKQEKAKAHEEEVKRIEELKAKEEERNKALLDGLKAIDDAVKVLNEGTLKGELKQLKDKYDSEFKLAQKAGLSVTKLREAFQKERNAIEAKYQKQEEEEKKKKDDEEHARVLAMIKRQKDVSDQLLAQHKAQVDAELEIEKEKQQAKEELRGLEAAGLGALSNLIGQQTAVGKGLAVAETTISTYTSAQKAYEGQMKLATPDAPVRAAIAAGIAIATGLARVKGILSVQVPNGGGASSGSSVSTPSVAAPVKPTVGTTTLDSKTINQIGNAAVKAYVVEADVTGKQERITRLSRAARLG